MKKLMVAAAVALLGAGAFADTFYVDANNGNDVWDGTTPEIPSQEVIDAGGTIPGPRKTLAAAAALLTANAGDILYVAEGLYDTGVMERANTESSKTSAPVIRYRIVLPTGSYLLASGRKSETIIQGEKDTTANGIGPDAVKCVYATGSYLKGLTIRGGFAQYSAAVYQEASQGGGVYEGCLLDCDILDCGAAYGGGAYDATVVRCHFKGGVASQGGPAFRYGKCYNCLFESLPYYATLYYCTAPINRPNQNGDLYGCCVPDQVAYGANVKSNTVYTSLANTSPDDTCLQASAAKINLDATTRTPLYGSVVIDYGNAVYYESVYPKSAFFADDKYKDFYGNPRIVGGQIDAGAIEAPSRLKIVDDKGYLSVEGAEVGVATDIVGDEVLTVLIRRVDPRCVGLKIGDEIVADFTAHDVSWAWKGAFDASSGETKIEAVYTTSTARHWYVDAVNGNDGDSHPGTFPDVGWAKKTLACAMKLAKSGDTVHAAPGVYDEGAMNDATYGSNRVVVADGVLLTADGGPDVTFIKGKKSEYSTSGCSTNSLRCVKIDGNGALCGFTLTDGYAPTHVNGVAINNRNKEIGGGLVGGLAVDCVVTNCNAPNGSGAVSSCKLLRCFIGKNLASDAGYMSVYLMDSIWAAGTACYSYCYAWNTTFVSGYIWSSSADTATARNCLFLGGSGKATHYNCISTSAIGYGVDKDGKCLFEQKLADLGYEEGTYRPVVGSLAVDRGNPDYYVAATNGWCAFWQSFVGKDYAKGQRVYNGTIDVGAGEHDWRGDFAKELAKKGVAVDVATPNVTTNLEAGLDVPAGESLRMKLVLKADGKVTFNVVAETGAVATVTAGGVPLTPGEGGAYGFEALAGETEVEIVVTGEGGKAVVSNVVLPKLGVLLLVR